MKLRTVVLLAAVMTASLALVPARAATSCVDGAEQTLSTAPILGLDGRYALPDEAPRTLVVMAHGYRNISDSWIPHLLAAAEDHGVLAVAMDNRGTGAAPGYRGWTVRAGAEDSIEAAQHFLAACQTIERTVMYGVSMGGNTAGLAVAAGATRPAATAKARPALGAKGRGLQARPLFDYLVAVEGAHNPIETYLGARAIAPVNAYAAGAHQDFVAECGGEIHEAPDCYRELNVVARTPEIAASGVKGVVLVHGLADGLVPYNQSREFATALRGSGVPTDFFTVARRNDWNNGATAAGEGGTTVESYATSNIPGTDVRPLAGHGWEGSTTHIVIRTGLDRLWALLEQNEIPADREFLTDSETGTTQLL